ncbi:ATP-binding cassette domain-containing protein [Cryobacterium breve]|uniref:ATP-binding cassette domain-containing protein n=1 Tax=Cryobacterium breve TaxID=1259258 RepID=UPI00248AD88B|nr:ATP-binding cassette domain-containing protein [Cryobacterium breve]
MSLVSVQGLSVVYEPNGAEPVPAVKDVSFDLEQGDFVGLVGESGSGKSTLGFALTGLSRPPARVSGGTILFDGVDIASLSPRDLRVQRHGGFAMVLQSGMNALNPVRSIRNHFYDIFAAHGHVSKANRAKRAAELVGKVELPVSVLDRFSGELSGGMRQRVSIALALSLEPRLMVFDEPTTALDVLVQHAVMDTIREPAEVRALHGRADQPRPWDGARGHRTRDGHARRSHRRGCPGRADPGRAAASVHPHAAQPLRRPACGRRRGARARRARRATGDGCIDRIRRLRRICRAGRVHSVCPGARGASPRGTRRPRGHCCQWGFQALSAAEPGEQPVLAVDNVSFTLEPGASMALVGASGSGKSTIAKLITGVERPTGGTITFGDLRIDTIKRRQAQAAAHRGPDGVPGPVCGTQPAAHRRVHPDQADPELLEAPRPGRPRPGARACSRPSG